MKRFLAWIAVLGLGFAVDAAAFDVSFVIEKEDPEASVVVLKLSEFVPCAWKVTAGEASFSFESPIDRLLPKDLADYMKATGIGVSYGWDSLLLQAGPQKTLAVKRRSARLIEVRVGIPAEEQALVETQGAKRLEEARARLLLEEGDTRQGLAVLEELSKRYPGDTEVLLGLAGANAYIGRRQRALEYFDQSEQIAPLEPVQQLMRRELQQSYEPWISSAGEFVNGGKGTHQRILRGGGEVDLHAAEGKLLAGGSVENNWFSTDEIYAIDGSISAVDVSRIRSALWARYLTPRDDQYRVTGYVADRNAGGGIDAELLDFHGSTALAAEWQRPNWDFLGTIAHFGTRDRLMARRAQRFTRSWQGNLGAAFQRYNLKHYYDAGSTFGLQGEVGYALRVDNPLVRLVYGLRAEYAMDMKDRVDAQGVKYNPLGFDSYEQHLFSLASEYLVNSAWRVGGYAGYAIDRLGGNTPYVSAYTQVDAAERLALRGSYSRTLATTGGATSGEPEDRFLVEARWTF